MVSSDPVFFLLELNSVFSDDTDLVDTAVQSPHALYGSSVETNVDFNKVRDACFLKFFPSSTGSEVIESWCEEGPNRFFFQQVSPVCLHVIPSLCSGSIQATSGLSMFQKLLDRPADSTFHLFTLRSQSSPASTCSPALEVSRRDSSRLG